jgi:hypothetical protein
MRNQNVAQEAAGLMLGDKFGEAAPSRGSQAETGLHAEACMNSGLQLGRLLRNLAPTIKRNAAI